MILFIDCHDSFSYNLTHLIASSCPVGVKVVHNDQINAEQLAAYLPFLDAIVLGPGPGDPHNSNDSGIVEKIWDLVAKDPVPVFGVCFGYQSMVLAFGGEVKRMHPPQHGQVGMVEHDGSSRLLKGVPSPFEAVRYHSLHSMAHVPLICTAKDFVTTPGMTVEMAAEHESLPIFGVQFHPESILSSYGSQLFKNFWNVAIEFNRDHRNVTAGSIPANMVVSHSPLLKFTEAKKQDVDLTIKESVNISGEQIKSIVKEVVILKSAASPGEWSIYGVLETGITPHIRSKNGVVYEGPLKTPPTSTLNNTTAWEQAAVFMEQRMISKEFAESINKDSCLPFLGGFIGYVSYEGGCEATIYKDKPVVESGLSSDISLVFITKSIVINELTGKAYLVGPNDWVFEMDKIVQEIDTSHNNRVNNSESSVLSTDFKWFQKTDFDSYQDKVSRCFENLKAGNSYELCLTTQTQFEFNSKIEPWDLFNHLVKRNPAPYCSYMEFDDVLVATSPERFMAWNHERCEFRPIKGTVQKSDTMNKERANEILQTPKERAENLMIVDLIRHDLGHLLENVTTPQLMAVEEYHSVYQLVSSVEGRFPKNWDNNISGIDVLSQSLPPGSMTGAPKVRSVEILRELEDQPRGLYSGVQGYWSIDDRGDWSVIIRSLFRPKENHNELWRLGAGGAITILSTVDGEFDEMNTKMNTVLNALE